MFDDLTKVIRRARNEGVLAAARAAASAAYWRYWPAASREAKLQREQDARNRAFDEESGVDTCGDLPLSMAGVDPSDAQRGNSIYRPIWTGTFHEAMSRLNISHGDYTFVDFGSGKGKALLLASHYPFKAIVGVEYAPVLHEAAQGNLARYQGRSRRCSNLRAICMDATRFELPSGPLVCFFFNPFDAETMTRVLSRIESAVRAESRPVHLIYVNVRDIAEGKAPFDRLQVFKVAATTGQILVMESTPSRASVPVLAAG